MSVNKDKIVQSDTDVNASSLASIYTHVPADLTISEISEGVKVLAAKYGIKSVMLIGSYARHTANKNSDIDLVIELEDELDSHSYFGFLEDAEELFKKKIDLFTLEGVERSVIKDQLLSGGIYLYGKA